MQVANITFSAAGSTRIETDSTANVIMMTVNSANVMYVSPGRTVFPTGSVNVDNDLSVSGVVRSGDFIRMESTDAGAGGGPYIHMRRDSASPAASDQLGGIYFYGNTTSNILHSYGFLEARILDATDGTEDGVVAIGSMVAGTEWQTQLLIANGVYTQGATGSGMGQGSINAQAYYLNGVALSAGDPAASQAEQEAATEAAKYVAPATQHFHPSAAKFWLRATQSSTTLEASYNITSVADTSAGVMTVTIANDMSSADYAVLVTVDDGSTTLVKSSVARSLAAGTFIMGSVVEAGSSADPTVAWMAVGFGDL